MCVRVCVRVCVCVGVCVCVRARSALRAFRLHVAHRVKVAVAPGPPQCWQLRRRDGSGQVDFPLEIMVRHDVTRLTSVLYACLADAFGNSTAVASACKAIVAPVEDLPAGVKVQRKRLVRSGEVLLGGGVNFWFDKQFGFTGKFGATAQLNFKITTEGAGFGDDSEPFIIKLLAGDLESLEVAPVEGEPLLNGASVRLRVRGMDEYSNPVSLGGSPVTVSSAAMIISDSEFVADEDPCAGVLSFTVVAPDPGKFECKVQCGEISKCAPMSQRATRGAPSHTVCVCVCVCVCATGTSALTSAAGAACRLS